LGTARSWRDVNSPRNRKRWHKLSSTGLRWDDGDLCRENEKGEWWLTGERSGDGDDDAVRRLPRRGEDGVRAATLSESSFYTHSKWHLDTTILYSQSRHDSR
jgi:hypothetical protein